MCLLSVYNYIRVRDTNVYHIIVFPFFLSLPHAPSRRCNILTATLSHLEPSTSPPNILTKLTRAKLKSSDLEKQKEPCVIKLEIHNIFLDEKAGDGVDLVSVKKKKRK